MANETEIDIFEDYMGVQYREGQQALKDGKSLIDNPYGETEMGKAWIDGFKGVDNLN